MRCIHLVVQELSLHPLGLKPELPIPSFDPLVSGQQIVPVPHDTDEALHPPRVLDEWEGSGEFGRSRRPGAMIDFSRFGDFECLLAHHLRLGVVRERSVMLVVSHVPRFQGVQGVIPSEADMLSWQEFEASLAHDDVSRDDEFAWGKCAV